MHLPRTLPALLVLLTILAGCASTDSAEPARSAALSLSVDPNPIVATQRSDGRWVFPFTVRISETGGRDVEIREVRADVVAFGGVRVHQEILTAEQIRELGYSTTIRAGETIRLPFSPARNVPDPALFQSVSADVRITATDSSGRNVSAGTNVRVRPA